MVLVERHGGSVVVQVARDEDALWQQLQHDCMGVTKEPSLRGNDTDADAPRHRVLSLSEAYYAISEAKLLPLPSQIPSLRSFWEECLRDTPNFAMHCLAQHHFRRMCWRMRSGLNYGAHYVLYRGDPTVYHSEYILYLQQDQYQQHHEQKQKPAALTWHVVQALTRIAEDVKKTVLLCSITTHSSSEASSSFVADSSPTETRVAANEVDASHGRASIQRQATYTFHGTSYTLDVAMIRFWDPSSLTEDPGSAAFQAQHVIRKPRGKRKNLHQAPHNPRKGGHRL